MKLPSAFSPLIAGDRVAPGFWGFWEAVRRCLAGTGGILRLPAYTVATLPDAAEHVRGLIYVSDGTGNKRMAVSDGTSWRFPDGNVVS